MPPRKQQASSRSALRSTPQAADIEIDTVGIDPPVLAEEIAELVKARGRNAKPVIVKVPVGGAPYEVVIGPGVLGDVGELVRVVAPNVQKVAIITDANVADLFGLTVESKLIESGFDVHPLSVEAGEQSKAWTVAGEVLEALAESEARSRRPGCCARGRRRG